MLLSICSGEDEMFEIIPNKGESFIVNAPHVLTLKVSGHGSIFYCKHTKRYTVSWFQDMRYRRATFQKHKYAIKFAKNIKKKSFFNYRYSLK